MVDSKPNDNPAHRRNPDAVSGDTPTVRASDMEQTHTQVSPQQGPVVNAADVPPEHSSPGYRIVRRLGRGGQGIVYEAVQEATKRVVAYKLLQSELDPVARDRFRNEIQLAAQLRHANIVSVHDAGTTPGGRAYYVMERVDGPPLDAYVREQGLPLEDALRLFVRVCEAVQFAHERGILHHDLKPSNILVDSDGNPRVLDFGLAQWRAAPADSPLTLDRNVIGTPSYMAPEQARNRPGELDARTDIYALGVMLYVILTGRFPYPVNDGNVLEHIAQSSPVRPSLNWQPDSGIAGRTGGPQPPKSCPIDDDLGAIVLKCLEKSRANRYESVRDLAADIERYLRGDAVAARGSGGAYVLAATLRSVIRRRPATALVLGLIAVVLATQLFAVPLIYLWTPANEHYERLLARFTPPVTGPVFDNVRILAVRDKPDVSTLAESLGLKDVSLQNPVSQRRLYGALMEELADSGLRVLAWDIRFKPVSDFDNDFVKGVSALKEAGADVIVRVQDWKLDEQGRPLMSSNLIPHTRWGSTTARLVEDKPWQVELVMQRGLNDAQPSLALAAVTSFWQPGCESELWLEPAGRALTVRFYRTVADAPRAKDYVEAERRIRLSDVGPIADDDPDNGLRRGDWMGVFLTPMPDQATLDEATVYLDQVFAADRTRLREWFDGKVVLVGDFRTDVDRHTYTDGRELSGCYAHAVAVDSLLRGSSIRMPLRAHSWIIIGGAALLGLGISSFVQPRPQRIVCLVALTLGIGLVCVIAYQRLGYLCHPLVPVSALLVCAAMTTAVRRQARLGIG